MTVVDLASLEDRIAERVREVGSPVSTSDLLQRHREALGEVTGQELRIAVWNLVNAGRLRFNANWNLEPATPDR